MNLFQDEMEQEELYKQVREKYNLICKVNLHVNN